MPAVKWIKITTDIFDDEKILLIESMPSADSIIVIWFKLLILAGKQNNDGVFMMSNRIAYTDEMLATIFRRDVNTVRLALNTFQKFGMIEILNDVITIPNWGKHQTLDSYEKKKERDRLYQQERRNKQKLLAESQTENSRYNSDDVSDDLSDDVSDDVSGDVSGDVSDDSSSYVAISEREEEGEEEREEDKERDIEYKTQKKNGIDYHSIINAYNDTCVSLPKVRSLSESRKKAIRARIHAGYTFYDFLELFRKSEASSFLKGKNNRDWSATFDWLIKDANMVKVLEGNYDDKGVNQNGSSDQRNTESPWGQLGDVL
jgi:predicted phage replisome organizer